MNSLGLLYVDELKGFVKSRVILALWVGLPLLAILMHAWSPSLEGNMPMSTFTALVVGSISGTLASAMLAVSIIHEKSRHVYELFLIRPMERRDIVLAKFLAVYSCLVIASVLTIGTGFVVDYGKVGAIPSPLISGTLESLGLSLSMTAIASAVGVLIGVMATSVLLGVILVIYGGNQVVSLVMLPFLTDFAGRSLLTILMGGVLVAAILYVAVLIFNRKQF